MKRLGLAIVIILLALSAGALEPDEILADPALEERARAITRTIRCMVCQNESIDESSASLARDLRILVRQQIEAGLTDREITDFIAARYGDVALLAPRLNRTNLGLYLSAPLLLLLGIVLALRARSTGSHETKEVDLAPEEQLIVARLLDDEAGNGHMGDPDHARDGVGARPGS